MEKSELRRASPREGAVNHSPAASPGITTGARMGNLVGVLCVLPVVVLFVTGVIISVQQFYSKPAVIAVTTAVIVNAANVVYLISYIN